MYSFVTRAISLAAIAVTLMAYNGVVGTRTRNEEINQLKADQEATQKKSAELIREAQEADSYADSISEVEEDSASESIYKDGTYEGEAQGYGGPIRISVVISDGKIASVNVTEHSKEDDTYYSMAATMTQAMVDKQSADVDLVSGATLSSIGIKNAAITALEGARK